MSGSLLTRGGGGLGGTERFPLAAVPKEER
jgi:hypothetical protein